MDVNQISVAALIDGQWEVFKTTDDRDDFDGVFNEAVEEFAKAHPEYVGKQMDFYAQHVVGVTWASVLVEKLDE